MEIMAPIGIKKDETIPIMTFTNDEPIMRCAICRTEHMAITNTIRPQKVLVKIQFAEDELGLTPTHYITDYSQLFYYKPLKPCSEHAWCSLLYEIIMRSKNGECDVVYVYKCKCSNEGCPDIILCNKINYDRLPPNFKSNTEFMKVEDLHKYVVSYE